MIYLHVPFCRSFYTYCDFYSEIACRDRDAQLFEAYADAVCAEAELRRGEIEATRGLNTLYIGGGTPSVLPLSYLQRIVSQLTTVSKTSPAGGGKRSGNWFFGKPARKIISGRPVWKTPPAGEDEEPLFIEFTVEVNPEDIVEKGAEYVQGLLGLGVNRISMGVQSLDDGILRWMNRRHDAARARQAFRILRESGADNLSVDLIFGLSQLSEAVFSTTLDEIVRWRPEHISAYQLSIEEDSALGEMVRTGRYTEATQEQSAAQYRLLCDTLRAAGYVHYEISNWALPGREAVHNSAYWSRHPYVGLGPGAHSFDGTVRSWNAESLPPRSGELPLRTSCCAGPLPLPSEAGPSLLRSRGWLRFSEAVAACAGGYERLSDEEAREEEIFLGLRTVRGVPNGLIDKPKAAEMLADGRLERTAEGRLRIPEDRWFVSDDLLSELI